MRRMALVLAALCLLPATLVTPVTRTGAAPRGPAGVARDADAVAHITAETDAEAVRLLGYVHAQDRLFQMDYLRRQPHVTFVWGNHDAAWLGACLGQEACIAHVLRISTRYRRLSQLEEGYGINLQPLELALWAIPTAIAAFIIHGSRLLLLDRSLAARKRGPAR